MGVLTELTPKLTSTALPAWERLVCNCWSQSSTHHRVNTASLPQEHAEQCGISPFPSTELYLQPPGGQRNPWSFCSSWKTFPAYVPRCST